MKKFLHKVFFKIAVTLTVIAVFIVIINVFARSIINQVPVSTVDTSQLRSKAAESILNDPKNSKTPPQKLLLGLYRSFACSIIGQSCFTNTQDSVKNSLLGKMASIGTFTLTNPPASGVHEVYTAFANTGLAPNIYAAQGIGFGSISGFRPIWKIFRNISYGFLVLVMVIISFMIMFRMKLNAQTAISIEAALPRIVLSLILITFSYAIAGFLIDAMYVVMGVSITMLCGNNTFCSANKTIDQYLNSGMGAVWNGFFPYEGRGNTTSGTIMKLFGGFFGTKPYLTSLFALSDSLLAILPPVIQGAVTLLGTIVNLALVNAIVSLGTQSQFFELTKNFQALTFGLGGLPPALIGGGLVGLMMALTFLTTPLILTFIIFLTLIFLFFRIFFMLMSTYLNILFYILFAPIMMLFEALPGQNAFSYWMRNMIGELITFPLLAIFLMVGGLIVNNFQLINPTVTQIIDWKSTNIWQPPFLSGWWSGAEQESFFMVIGMGIIFIIPDLIKMVKDMLGVKPPPVSIGLGTFMAGGAMAWGGGMGLLGSAFKWSGNIYGHDAEGRKNGLQGKMGKWMAPVKEMFVKRTDPDPLKQANMNPKEIEAQGKKSFAQKYWDVEIERDAGGKLKPKVENGQEVKRTTNPWTRSVAGRQQTKDIEEMYAQQKKEEDDAEKARLADHAKKVAEAATRTNTASQPQPDTTTTKPTAPSATDQMMDKLKNIVTDPNKGKTS